MSTGSRPAGGGSKGFFESLFDWEFESFVTLRFIKVIYVIAVVAVGLGALLVTLSAVRGGGLLALVVLVGGVVGFFVYVILVRIYLEVIALLFRIGENTSAILAAVKGSSQE